MLYDIDNKEFQVRLEFLEEAQDNLSTIEWHIVGVVNNSIEQQKAEKILRLLHNIKGGASMMSFFVLSDYAHQLEAVFKVLKLYQEVPVIDVKFKDLLIASLYCIYKVIDFSRKGLEIDKNWLEKEANSKFNTLWQKLAHLQNYTETALIPISIENANKSQAAKVFEVEIGKSLALANKEPATESLYCLSPVETSRLAIPVEEIETHTDLRQVCITPAATPSLETNFEAQGATVRVPVHYLDKISDFIDELSIERFSIEQNVERLQNLAKTLNRRVQFLEQSNAHLRFAYDKSKITSQTKELLLENNGLDSLEMDQYDEVDTLFQDVAETIVQIQEINPDLNTSLADVTQAVAKQKRSFKEMETTLTQARMQPLSEILSLFHRHLRELSLEYGKKVELVIEGKETLIDRKILKALGDPLLHLLRNAFDHGIEETNIRRAHGKPAEGKITIKAYQCKDQIIITVNDDGGGIDVEKVRLRAIQDGLLSEQQLNSATTTDLINLVFEPGFSTADEVTSLSGHGIGLDVVRINLEIIRGSVKVDSQPGLGTTFTLTVPLNLSLATILLVESKGLLLAFPTDAVKEMIPHNINKVFVISSNHVLNYNNFVIPLFILSDWLEYKSKRRQESLEGEPEMNQPSILIFNQGQKEIGVQVDRYWGEHEVTIRQVKSNILMPIGFKGCTVLNGRVVPIVNTTEILQWLTSKEENYQNYRLPDNPSTSLISQLTLNQELKTRLPALPASKNKKCILVVDDSVSVRRFLAVVLEKAEYEVEQARDGQDALDKLNSQLSVAAIICDIEMPRMNGYEFLCNIKKRENLNEIPIIMLTSRSGEKHQKIAFDLGANAYLSKPYNEQNLLKTLGSLILEK